MCIKGSLALRGRVGVMVKKTEQWGEYVLKKGLKYLTLNCRVVWREVLKWQRKSEIKLKILFIFHLSE